MELFTEITVKTTHEGSELVADILSEYSSEGVFIEDKEDVKYLENLGKTWDYIDDKAVFCESFVTVKGYVKENDENAVKEISERLEKLKSFKGSFVYFVDEVKEFPVEFFRIDVKEYMSAMFKGIALCVRRILCPFRIPL